MIQSSQCGDNLRISCFELCLKMNTSLQNPESYDYKKSFSSFECSKKLISSKKKIIQNLSTDFGIACDDMIDQLVTIQLISGILKHQKAEVDDDVNLLCLNPFATVRKSNALRSSLRSFKIQKICTAPANFHPCRMRFKSTCNSE